MAGGKAWLRRAVLVLPMLPIGAGVSTNVWADGLTPGDLVISTVTGSSLDAASAITLFQFVLTANGTTATPAGSLTLPQTSSGANQAISGEYGSASEGFLTQSVNQQYLTIMGYGVNASTFNSAPVATYGTAALGQTTSLTGQSVTTVPRVVALIGADGSVNTTTALTGVFNTNNPRSAVTVDGSAFYVSGQGASKTDTTQGVFYAPFGATTATANGHQHPLCFPRLQPARKRCPEQHECRQPHRPRRLASHIFFGGGQHAYRAARKSPLQRRQQRFNQSHIGFGKRRKQQPYRQLRLSQPAAIFLRQSHCSLRGG